MATVCRQLVADRGYDARAILERTEATGARGHIPTQHNLIEHFFNKLEHFRLIATRFVKPARN